MAKVKIISSAERGFANHGWLKSHHSFSFASYQDPSKMGFGKLRVLNDDFVAASMGFDTHSHQNMEIVTIPLLGTLRHKDSLGNTAFIEAGEVQIMSAGSGISHSEFNHSDEQEVNFLQIWIHPEQNQLEPSYGQEKYNLADLQNNFKNIVQPIALPKAKGVVCIHQQVFFSLGFIDEQIKVNYKFQLDDKQSGVYMFVLQGEVEAEGTIIRQRDAAEVTETASLDIVSKADSKVLLIETVV
jgi:quercetin 2,3-dioxygenase